MTSKDEVTNFVWDEFIKPLQPLVGDSRDNAIIISEIQSRLTAGLYRIYNEHYDIAHPLSIKEYLSEFFELPEK